MDERNCENCKHYVVKDTRTNWGDQETTCIKGCESWDCEYEPKITAEDKLERIREILDKAPNTLYFRMIREVVEDENDD